MRDFQGKIAVVAGAARGIGRAIAGRCAKEGMPVVVAGYQGTALQQAAAEIEAGGGTALAVATDVARVADVQALARRTLEVFGGAHLLFNGAGIVPALDAGQLGTKDRLWLLGTNLWGTIHGLQVFVPLMLAQGDAGHIVNTAVLPGPVAPDLCGPYGANKHAGFCRAKTQAVVALSEKLNHDLKLAGEEVRLSVVCPAWARTQITDAVRNRPPLLDDDPALGEYRASGQALEQMAERVFEAIHEEVFYILAPTEPVSPVPVVLTPSLQESLPLRYAAIKP